MISNWDFSLALVISELLVDPQQPSSLLDIKLHAFQKAKNLMLQYEKRGIRRDLLDVILDKKLKLILKAETANEVKRASEPPKPVYNYGTWREDPFSVPEEELAMWAIVSQQHADPAGSGAIYGSFYSRVRNHEGAAYKRPTPRCEVGGAIGWISTSESIYSITFKDTMSSDCPLLFPSLSIRRIPATIGSSKSSSAA